MLLLIFVAFLFLRTRRLKRTLEEREGQLVIAREKAEESDMLKSAFLANMSHEIRTPLNAIVGFSSLMQGEELSQEERAEYCAIVVNNSEMLLTLLNDILDISSLECGKIRFNYSAEEIVQICQHILMTTAHTCQPGVEGRLECAVDSYMLTTDVHRLSQILINLLTNAAKFTSEGSIVLGVEICPEQNEVLFSVTDTGPGIPLDKQEMIFNRFEKLDGNKKKGTGLGLALAEQIITSHKGYIYAESKKGEGSTFHIYLPVLDTEHMPQIVQNIPRKDYRIVVADDNAKVLQLLKKNFEKIGIQIQTCMKREELQKCLEQQQADVLVVDETMEDCSGVDFCMSLAGRYPDMRKLIIIDGVSREVAEARQKGIIDGYVEKPVSDTAILEAIRNCASQPV